MDKITIAIGAVVHSSKLCPIRFQSQKSNILTLSWVISLKVPVLELWFWLQFQEHLCKF